MVSDGQVEMFGVPELTMNPASVGRAEAGLIRAIAGADLDDQHAGLAAGALVAARALDAAERAGGTKGGYLIAQLLKPYQDALAGLGLPAAIAPTPRGGASPAGQIPDDLSSLLGDHFGPT